LTREAAAAVLERAGGELKTAIIMERLGMDRETALELLKEHDGLLRPILE
ncbi:MAG: N-acetylmuramic acid 6-phosphate etherase, partial [Planctomycetes bacterium]|nr:N-acetylmuramic acid 6-phosphate etherase [Planctomycetota bacterium]